MPKNKVILSYITNDEKRKASFKKRKRGLFKKANELSILCNVDACVVIYGPYHQEPDVWPSRSGALSVLDRFNNLPEMHRESKMTDMTSFTQEHIKKLQYQVNRIRRVTARQAMENYMYASRAGLKSIHDFDMVHQGSEMNSVISQTLHSIKSKMESMKGGGEQHDNASSGFAATLVDSTQFGGQLIPNGTIGASSTANEATSEFGKD